MNQAQIIFFNGASSSGKSTLAQALQAKLPTPYLHISEDMFFNTLPSWAFELENFFTYGHRLYHGFAESVAALAKCQNQIIVDTVAWNPGSLMSFVKSLQGLEVLAVGVHCDLAILEAREKERGDRSVGLAKKQFELVHQNALYDIEVNTSSMDLADCVQRVITALETPKKPTAFDRMAQFSTN